jgi:DNA-binding transcriptional MerR regulator
VLKIGEFSALAGVPVKTLRYYDALGLLAPAHVDADTGYRYYAVGQLSRLHRVLALKDLGFPLDQIGRALSDGVSPETLRGMLMLRVAEQEAQLRREDDRLRRLNALVRLIDHEGDRAGDVVLKTVPAQRMASLRERIDRYRDVGALFARLHGIVGPAASPSPGVAIWHDTEHRQRDFDVEVGLLVKASIDVDPPASIVELPGGRVASIVHHGAFAQIKEPCMAIFHWIEANGYRAAGPLREWFLRVSAPASRDDASNVVEIQIPVDGAAR